jgi:hypothetical protein
VNIDKIVKQCERLNSYSVRSRYPDEMIITEQQMQTAIIDAREILEFCLTFYPQK